MRLEITQKNIIDEQIKQLRKHIEEYDRKAIQLGFRKTARQRSDYTILSIALDHELSRIKDKTQRLDEMIRSAEDERSKDLH